MTPGSEINELYEQAEKANESALQPVSVTMAILAVLVAAVTVLGHRAHTHEIILQAKITNGWGFYQSKSTRRHSAELFRDFLSVSPRRTGSEQAALDLQARYASEAERYRTQSDGIQQANEALEAAFEHQERRADRFDLSEGVLEASLVLTSVTLLTRRRVFWGLGMGIAGLGLLLAFSAFLVG